MVDVIETQEVFVTMKEERKEYFNTSVNIALFLVKRNYQKQMINYLFLAEQFD